MLAFDGPERKLRKDHHVRKEYTFQYKINLDLLHVILVYCTFYPVTKIFWISKIISQFQIVKDKKY
jgi:hypothetical protein